MRFTQKSCMYATQELHPQFPSLSGLFCLVHQIFSKLILSWTTSSLSLSLSNLTNSKFPIILWTIQNLFSLVVLTTPTYLFITFWFLGITTIRFWLKGNHTINRLAWKQITGFAAKVAWGTVLYSVLLLNLVSLTKNKHYCKCIINFRGWNLPVPIPMVMLLCMSYLCLCFLGFKVFVACLGGAYWGWDFFFGKLSVWLLSFALYFTLVHNILIVLILSLIFHCHVNLVFAIISWIKIADIANGQNKKLVLGKKKKKKFILIICHDTNFHQIT